MFQKTKTMFYRFLFIIKILLFSLFVSAGSGGDSDEDNDAGIDSLFNMSIEELTRVVVETGTYVGTEKIHVPASVTTITKAEILLTPATNIADLIEIYVPGATWVSNGEGVTIGIRGIISDRNYKMLLLVNGVNLNQKAHNGALLELDHWDLNDIESIEIIRGPGSVVYGPGAINGIVNIKTIKATDNGLKGFVNYNKTYRSKGGGFYHSVKRENYSLFLYNSIQSTQGSPDKLFLAANHYDVGWVGTDDFRDVSAYRKGVLSDNLADYENQPQIKSMLQLNFKHGFSAMIRYTQAGAVLRNGIKQKYVIGYDADTNYIFSDLVNGRQIQYKGLSSYIEKKSKINDNVDVKLRINYVNQLFNRNTIAPRKMPFNRYSQDLYYYQKFQRYANPTDAFYKNQYFSEQVLTPEIIGKYKSDKLDVAAGGSISFNHWDKPWGKTSDYFAAGEGYFRIVSDSATTLYHNFYDNGTPLERPEGWSTVTLSGFAEISFQATESMMFIASARYDKDTYSKSLFSPRIAVSYEINDKNLVKAIGQISNRINTAESMIYKNEFNVPAYPEKLTGGEIIYTRIQGKKLLLNVSSFYNRNEVIAWRDNEFGTVLLGTIDIAGSEAEMLYSNKFLTCGLNHSFTKQVSMSVEDTSTVMVTQTSSYFNLDTPFGIDEDRDTIKLRGSGNDLTNWSNHTTKLYANWKVFNRITLHLNSQFFWKYQGNQNYLDIYETAAENSTSQDYKGTISHFLERFDEVGLYKLNYKVNAAVHYRINNRIGVVLSGTNLTGSFKQYTYLMPHTKHPTFYNRVAFSKAPIALSIKVNAKL